MPIDIRNTENICPTCNHVCHCQLNNPPDTRYVNADHHGKCGICENGKTFPLNNEGDHFNTNPNWEDELCGCASCGCPAAQ
tara:strand:+ start:374 stop:616 length:243 start_codon:yes stop_codon:yes gene_type:complete